MLLASAPNRWHRLLVTDRPVGTAACYTTLRCNAPTPPVRLQGPRKKSVMRPEEATDFMSSMLTRRFGLKGGLAWLGLLTLGVVGEQVKTRLEVAADEKNTVEVQVRTATERVGVGLRRQTVCRGEPCCSKDRSLLTWRGVRHACRSPTPAGCQGGQACVRGLLCRACSRRRLPRAARLPDGGQLQGNR